MTSIQMVRCAAGNDINELYAPRTSQEQYKRFWVLSNHFLAQVNCGLSSVWGLSSTLGSALDPSSSTQVYRSRLATVSAIKGACPAGGCCLSLCCDTRVMTEQGHIGLNEVALGIPVPVYWARLMAAVIGQGPAERLCFSATLLSPQEALRLGMVDKVWAPVCLSSCSRLPLLSCVALARL